MRMRSARHLTYTRGTGLFVKPIRTPLLGGVKGTRTLLRMATKAQSNVENKPPHTPKLPPMRGASRRTACKISVRTDDLAQLRASLRGLSEGRWLKGCVLHISYVTALTLLKRFICLRVSLRRDIVQAYLTIFETRRIRLA